MEQALNIKESSTIQSATFDAEAQTITIQFKSGHSGSYPATEDEALAFEQADSPGKHHDIYFKKAGKQYSKLT